MSGYNSHPSSKERTLLYHSIERRDACDPVQRVTGHFRAGECVALLGPRRCGKHTLLHALANADVDGGVIAWSDARVDTAWMRCNSRRVTAEHLDPSLTPRELLTYYALLYHTPSRHRPIQLVVLPILRDFCLLPTADVALCHQGDDVAWRLRLAVGVISGSRILWIDHTSHQRLTESELRHGLLCLFQFRNDERIFVCTLDEPNHNLLIQFDRCIILANGHQIFNGRPRNIHELFKFPSTNPHIGILYDWLAARDDSDATDDTRRNRRLDLQHASINHNHLGSYEHAANLPVALTPPYECGCTSRHLVRGPVALAGLTYAKLCKRSFAYHILCVVPWVAALFLMMLTGATFTNLQVHDPSLHLLGGQLILVAYAILLPPLSHAPLWRFDAIYSLQSPLLNTGWLVLSDLVVLTPAVLTYLAWWRYFELRSTNLHHQLKIAVFSALLIRRLVLISRRLLGGCVTSRLGLFATGSCVTLVIGLYYLALPPNDPDLEECVLSGALTLLAALSLPHSLFLAWNAKSRLTAWRRSKRNLSCNSNWASRQLWDSSDEESLRLQ